MVIQTHLNQIDLADRWKISERTLERWRWLGKGPAYLKLGGRCIYKFEDIEKYERGVRITNHEQSCDPSTA